MPACLGSWHGLWTCRGNDLAKLGFEGLWRKAMRDLREIDFQPGMRATGMTRGSGRHPGVRKPSGR